jgi:Cu-Zn family superoxide dismutase
VSLPNFEVGEEGRAKVSLVASHVTLWAGPNLLFHPEGAALVIHEKPDDYMTDPAGNAGARNRRGISGH